MVFAAGLGTRMRPVTDTMPKSLVPVGGKPLIDHMLDRFAEIGLDRAIVNLHYFADQIEAHLAKLLPLLGDDPFFLCNTDAFWLEGPRSNLGALAASWNPAMMDVLLLVASTTTSVGVDWAGDFTMTPEGRLLRREERAVAPFVYAGVGIIKPELFATRPDDTPVRLAPCFFEAAEKGRLFGHRLEGQWLHVGTPEAIVEAEETIHHSVW